MEVWLPLISEDGSGLKQSSIFLTSITELTRVFQGNTLGEEDKKTKHGT